MLAWGEHPRFGQRGGRELCAQYRLDFRRHRGDRGRGGGHDAVAPGPLGLVERLVGGLEEGLVDDLLPAGGAQAEGDCDRDARGPGLLDRRAQALGDLLASDGETPGSTIRNSSPPRR